MFDAAAAVCADDQQVGRLFIDRGEDLARGMPAPDRRFRVHTEGAGAIAGGRQVGECLLALFLVALVWLLPRLGRLALMPFRRMARWRQQP